MGTFNRRLLFFAALSLLVGSAVRARNTPPLYDVPRIDRISVDGRLEDWGEKEGLRVDVLTPVSGILSAYDGFDPRFGRWGCMNLS